MTSIEKLTKHFERFPGIGPRQARRFVYHLLGEEKASVTELAELINNIQTETVACTSCFRFFVPYNGSVSLCGICADAGRNSELLMVLESDSDITAVERSGIFDGSYFVLGGSVPLMDSVDTKKIRSAALKDVVETRAHEGLTEIILAFSVNPDGENTTRYVESILKDLTKQYNLTITHLGRGLSTGSELEYADPDTIKNALENRR